jgi:hypothetical protein
MRRHMISCLMIILACATSGVAQSKSKPPASTPDPAPVTDIRKVDFLNFSYPSSLCSVEYGRQGIGKMVRVREGEFKNKSVYFAVVADKVIYGDVTGDGREEAIVPVDCGAVTANFSRSEIYIYTINEGRPTLVAALNDKTLEEDYRRAYPKAESYWGLTGEGFKIKNGNLEIEVLADGSHAAPQYIVTLQYHMNGERFSLLGKPQRRNSSQ